MWWQLIIAFVMIYLLVAVAHGAYVLFLVHVVDRPKEKPRHF